MKVAFHNLGCKVNSYETEAMVKQFTDHGCRLVSFDEIADVYIVNTCSVTHIADRKSRQMLHRAKKQNPSALVVAVGCFAQANPESAINDDAVDLIIGNADKSRTYELVTARRNMCRDISDEKSFDEMRIDESVLHTRAFVKVQDGCNQFCSYCLIPYLRGRIRSRKAEDTVSEVSRLVKAGCKEVVITGIHLSSYGLDFSGDKVLSFNEVCNSRPELLGKELLKLLHKISSVIEGGRIRLGSLEPRIITEDFVRELSEIKNVCPHFHLSLQSGCDATLKRMNRHYTTEDFEKSVAIIRRYYEHPAITTDVIVGFPGESDEEFEKTFAYLSKINLYEMHIFKYSVRSGTAAEKLPGRIPDDVSSARSERLTGLSEKNKADFAAYYSGRNVSVLLEEEVEAFGRTYFTGYNPEYVRFYVPAEGRNQGEIVEFLPKP